MGDGSRAPTVDQLRKEIDRGQTADKAPGVYPAAAPLGTDDEAGGNPPTPEQRAMEAAARRQDGPKRPIPGDDATESIRNAKVPEGLAGRPAEAEKPTGGGNTRKSVQSGKDTPERGGRVAEVVPSREDDATGALNDDLSPAQARPSAEPWEGAWSVRARD